MMQNTICSPKLLSNGMYSLQFPGLQLQNFQHLAQSADDLLVGPITLSPCTFSPWQGSLQQWDIKATGADIALPVDASTSTYLNPDGSPPVGSWMVSGLINIKDICGRAPETLSAPLALDWANPHGLVAQIRVDATNFSTSGGNEGGVDILTKVLSSPLHVAIRDLNPPVYSHEVSNTTQESNKWIQSKGKQSNTDNLLQPLRPISAFASYDKSKRKTQNAFVGRATKWNTVDELAFFLLILQYNGTRYKQFAKNFPAKEIKSLNNKWQLEKKRAQKNMYLDWKTVIVSLLCRYLSIVGHKQDGVVSGIRATLTTVLSNINPSELNTFNRGRHAMYSRTLFKKICKMLGDTQLKSLEIDPNGDTEG